MTMQIEYSGKKYRPFKNDEEFKPHRDKWVRNLTPYDELLRIGCIGRGGVTIGGKSFTWACLFMSAKFEDGSPCGVVDEPKWRPATQDDVTSPPKICRVRDSTNEQWKSGRLLVYMYPEDAFVKFVTINPSARTHANWVYCEVLE